MQKCRVHDCDVRVRMQALMPLFTALQELLGSAVGLSLHQNTNHITVFHGPDSGHTSGVCWGIMRSGHKADTLQRRRRRIKFIAAPCATVLLIYVLAGSPTVPPLRRSSVRSRSLLLLDTLHNTHQQLQQQQHLMEQPQRPALLSRLQQAMQLWWHGRLAADAMHVELATCLADAAPDKAAAAYTIDDFVGGRPARCTLLLCALRDE